MKLKKIPYKITLVLLTSGASLILGFLSFGGMLAISPLLPLAFAAFTLSVAYEGEIYLQNIKGALSKLFKHNHMKQRMARAYLLDLFTNKTLDTTSDTCPQFFKDYQAQCKVLMQFEHQAWDEASHQYRPLDAASLKRQSQAEKTLRDMEKWFACQLFNQGENNTLIDGDYQKKLQTWLKKNHREELIDQLRDQKSEFQLETYIAKNIDITAAHCPLFFKQYQMLSNQLHAFGYQVLDENTFRHRATIAEKKATMEQWFIDTLSDRNQEPSSTIVSQDIQQNLNAWFSQKENDVRVYQFNTQKTQFHFLKVLSSLSALFMGLGTTYLLADAFAVIPWLTALSMTTVSWLVVPMAMVSGVAYGLLTYNAMTDMLTNNRVKAAYQKIFGSKEKWTPHRGFMALAAIGLFVIAIMLTVCTAGTWWTVAKDVPPLFHWMKKLPSTVMGVINPIITGFSALVFNVQNTAESLELIEGLSAPKQSRIQSLKDAWKTLKEKEHWLQWINPFRLILKLTIMPLRVLLFLGHLISIGVTADRVPRVPQIVSTLLGFVSEGFEDLHYFVPHHHGSCCGHSHDVASFIKGRLTPGHGHTHALDLPTQVLKGIFYPVYWLAAAWDALASRMDANKTIDFDRAWDKQHGIPTKEKEVSVTVSAPERPSLQWTTEHVSYRIDRHIEKQLQPVWIGSELAQKKIEVLRTLQQECIKPGERQHSVGLNSSQKATLSQHRCSMFAEGKAQSEQFIERLPELCPGVVIA